VSYWASFEDLVEIVERELAAAEDMYPHLAPKLRRIAELIKRRCEVTYSEEEAASCLAAIAGFIGVHAGLKEDRIRRLMEMMEPEFREAFGELLEEY